MDIYYGGEPHAFIVTDESYCYQKLMGENALTLIVLMPTFVEIPVGAYVVFEGETYYLLKPQYFTKNNSRDFAYTLILQSSKSKLSLYKLRDMVSKRLKFSLTAKPLEHLSLILWNMNQRESGWSVDACIDAVEICLNYNHTYCEEALTMLATACKTEYAVNVKSISLGRVESNKTLETALPLSYGFGNGFKSGVRRDNYDQSKAIEVLFVQGGSKNINATEYLSPELLLPINKTIGYDGTLFSNEVGYNAAIAREYVSDENGYSIQRDDKELSTHVEDSLDLSNIYPQRVGIVSGVDDSDAEHNNYDFFDILIPDALDYSLCRLDGVKATVIFQSGMLAGKEFDIVQTDTALTGYIHINPDTSDEERRFKLVPQEIDGAMMPNDVFKPVIGDKYAVFGITMPDAYVCDDINKIGASWDMFRESVKYFFENEEPRFTFTGELDPVWSKLNWIDRTVGETLITGINSKILIGGYVKFTDEQFQAAPVLIRQIGIKKYINNPHVPIIELSNITVGGNSLSSVLAVIDQNEVVVEVNHKNSEQFAKRGFRDVKETAALLQASLLNFSGAISPITVQTMQLLVGDESLQYEFVADETSIVAIPHFEGYDTIDKTFSCDAGVLQHKTLGIENISSSHVAADFKWWDMTALDPTTLEDDTLPYYVYAKVSKTSPTGEFILSVIPMPLSDSTYYYLLVGILNSLNDGDRSYVPMYGYSEITPARVTTKKLISPDGKTYVDLEHSIIKGNISFYSSEDNSYTEVGAGINDAIDLNNTNYVDALKLNLQNQIDGQIISWFRQIDPTLSNSPANDWYVAGNPTSTENLRNQHANDTYTNTSTGHCWRFVYDGSILSWAWVEITDTATVQALILAGLAQDTADGKRRVFTAQPTTSDIYDVGDLWVNATSGAYSNDLLRANTHKSAGTAFNISHWSLASKYTDNSALTTFMAGAYATTIASLNTQLDKKAETFYQEAMPHAEDINDDDSGSYGDNSAFVGDLWYKLSTKETFIFRCVNHGTTVDWTAGHYFDFKWFPMEIPLSVFDTIDGKASIFVSQPSTYNVRDMWILAADTTLHSQFYKAGTILTSSTDRITNFVAADWTEKVRYTDDTALNDMVVGGANLIENSDFSLLNGAEMAGWTRGGTNGATKITQVAVAGVPAAQFNSVGTYTDADLWKDLSSVLAKVTAYNLVFSIDYYQYSADKHLVIDFNGDVDQSMICVDNAFYGKWKRYTMVLTSATPIKTLSVYLYGETSYHADGYITHLSLQVGTKPTSWKPSTQYLADALKSSTDVYGGLTIGNILAVKNADGLVVGGINGGESDIVNDIRLWFGKIISEMEDAPFKIYEDGTIEISNEKDNQVVVVSKNPIPTLAALLAAKTYTDLGSGVTSDIEHMTNSASNEYATASFTVAESGSLYLRAFLSSDYSVSGVEFNIGPADSRITGFIKLQKWNASTSTWGDYYSYGKNVGSLYYGQFVYDKHYLPAGTYRLSYSCTVTLTSGLADELIAWIDTTALYSDNTNKTIIGVDGIASIEENMTGQKKYFYMSQNDINYFVQAAGNFQWLSPDENFGLQISNAGVKIKRSGGSWATL